MIGVAISTRSKERGPAADRDSKKGKMSREELVDIIQNGAERRKAVLADMGFEVRGSPCMGNEHLVNSCTGESISEELQMHIMKAAVRRVVEERPRLKKEGKKSKS